MKRVLIHCAMEKEAYEIANKLELVRDNNSATTLYTSTNVDLLVTGIGKQRTAISLVQYLENYKKPDIIINVGFAGSTNTKIGKWINVSKSYNLEWNIPNEEKYSMDIGNKELVSIQGIESLPCYTSESFVTQTDIKEDVIFDMELHSVSLVADIYKIPLLSLKKVSDNLSLDDYYKNIDDKGVMELESVTKYIDDILKGQ